MHSKITTQEPQAFEIISQHITHAASTQFSIISTYQKAGEIYKKLNHPEFENVALRAKDLNYQKVCIHHTVTREEGKGRGRTDRDRAGSLRPILHS